jgi:hypothetical protein
MTCGGCVFGVAEEDAIRCGVSGRFRSAEAECDLEAADRQAVLGAAIAIAREGGEMSLTFPFDEEMSARITDAMCKKYNWEPTVNGQPNPEKREDFAARQVVYLVMADLTEVEKPAVVATAEETYARDLRDKLDAVAATAAKAG